MISLLDKAARADFLAVCGGDIAQGAEIATHLAVYGPGAREAEFWLQRDASGAPTAAVERQNGRVNISAADGADTDELRDFLEAVGGFGQLRAEAGLCARLGLGGELFTAPVMRYPGGFSGIADPEIVEGIPLGELYPMIGAAFQDFDAHGGARWYAYASHLFRHGMGSVAGIYRDGRLASTGGVYAQNGRYGVIACLVTDPACRGQGHAGRIVRWLCDRILAGGRVPTLRCAEDSLAHYYEGLGFYICGRWGKRMLS